MAMRMRLGGRWVRVYPTATGQEVGAATAGALGSATALIFGSVAFVGTVAVTVAIYLVWWLCTYPFESLRIVEFWPGLVGAVRLGIGIGLAALALVLLAVLGWLIWMLVHVAGWWVGLLVLAFGLVNIKTRRS
jgi:hypothetical protein